MTPDDLKIKFYYLNPDHSVGWTNDVLEWARRYSEYDCRVALTVVAPGVEVSTVFLRIDHNFFGDRPVLFETAVGTDYGYEIIDRYSTWDEALQGHKEVVAAVENKVGQKGGPKALFPLRPPLGD